MEEVEGLIAMYPEEGAVVMDDPEAASHSGQTSEEKHNTPHTPLSGSIFFPGLLVEGRRCGLHFQLPHNYPAWPPSLQVICEGVRSTHDELTKVVSHCVQQHTSAGGTLLLALNDLQEAIEALPPSQENQGGGGEPLPEVAREGLTRLVLWMHHVKNLNKRKSIVGWAGELHVRGFSKPGFPGIVICEGRDSDVKEYCRRLKAMRWQAIGVRAEESDQPVIESQGSYAWHFLEDFRELGEGDMDVLAVRCAEAGLTHLFKAALKLQ